MLLSSMLVFSMYNVSYICDEEETQPMGLRSCNDHKVDVKCCKHKMSKLNYFLS